MSTTLTASLKVIFDSLFAEAAVAAQFGTASANINRQLNQAFANGVGLNQADRIFSETRTIAASGTHLYDLTALTDIFAVALSFVRIKAILVFADAGNTNNVVIGATVATQFLGPMGTATDTIAVGPGGVLVATAPTAAGWAVGAAPDLLFTNSAGVTGVTYDIIFVGGSA
jgi:hypothetical protein